MRKGLLDPRFVLKCRCAWPLSSCRVRLKPNACIAQPVHVEVLELDQNFFVLNTNSWTVFFLGTQRQRNCYTLIMIANQCACRHEKETEPDSNNLNKTLGERCCSNWPRFDMIRTRIKRGRNHSKNEVPQYH